MLTVAIILALLVVSIVLAMGVARSVMSVMFHFMKVYSGPRVTPLRVSANR